MPTAAPSRVASLVVVVVSAFLHASWSAADAHHATRVVSAHGWAYDVPAHWTDVPPPAPSTVSAARDTVMHAGMATNVNLNREAFTGGAMDYANAAVAGVRQVARVESQRTVTYGALTGLLVESTWHGSAVAYRTMQFITAAGGFGYVLTCTASLQAYRAAVPTCRAALASFRAAP